MAFTFYSDIINQLNTKLATYVGDTVADVSSAIAPVAVTLGTIYVMMWGWAMMRGVISEPILDGVNRILRIVIVTTLALQVGMYSTYVSSWLWETPDAIAGVVAGAGATTGPEYLDKMWTDMFAFGEKYKVAAEANDTMGIPDMGLMLAAFAIWGMGIVATGYAAFLLVLSKTGLAILLGIGPLFILMIMFESTKRFFDVWLGQALNFVFMAMLSAAGVKLILSLVQSYLDGVAAGPTPSLPGIDMAIQAVVFCLVGALVLMQVPAIASALGGGVALGTLGAVNWAYGKTMGTAAAMRPTNLRREARKLALDARIVSGAASQIASPAIAAARAVGRGVGVGTNKVSKS